MTVAQLIRQLEVYPPETEIVSKAADSGGYDSIFTKDIEVLRFKHTGNVLRFPEYENDLYVGGRDEVA